MSDRRNRRTTRKGAGKSGMLAQEKIQTNMLEQLKMYASAEYNGILPTVVDVPMLHLKRDKVYSFERTFEGPLLAAPASVALFGAFQFNLAAVPSPSDFTSLFDTYRIAMVEVSFLPTNPALIAAALYTVIDYDDANVPASAAELLQYDTLQVTASNQITKRTFVPKIALAAYSGTFTSYAAAKSQWIDCDSSSVQHYGLKYCLPALASSTATANQYQVIVKMILQFKNPR